MMRPDDYNPGSNDHPKAAAAAAVRPNTNDHQAAAAAKACAARHLGGRLG